MKRDLDMMKTLLIAIESKGFDKPYLSLRDFQCKTPEEQYEVSGHMRLLIEDGLVEGKIDTFLGMKIADFRAMRLRSSGHEFLNLIRNDTVWNKTKDTILQKGLEVSVETIKAVAAAAITSMLGLSA